MKSVADLINDERNAGAVFVFPSEAAAAFRRKRYLLESGRRAVRNDRFLSWDRFKEEITLHNRTDRPANSMLRRIFAAEISERNSGDPVFTELIPSQYRQQTGAFADTIFRVLPELDRLITAVNEPGTDFSSALKADYNKLYHEYTAFLHSHGLFEPSWETPDFQRSDRDYLVIGPEIIEDASEYRELLIEAGCRFHPAEGRLSGSFRQFENSVIEADAVLGEIAELLEKGVHFSEIILTSADEAFTGILMSRARIRGIPLNYRSGRPLAEQPAGRLPELLRDCRTSGYSIDSMKNLLMFRAFIWKEQELTAELVQFGIEHRCIKNLSQSPSGDLWAARLKSAGRGRLLAFYIGLKKRIEAFCSSGSFSVLSKELQKFLNAFMETSSEAWGEAPEQVFQRTREVLSSLCEAEQQLEGIKISDPLGLWIELLKEKIYVRQQPASAVSVFPYRVSALTDPEYHFVAGLSHDSSTIVSTAFPFLTDQQRRSLSVAENNMSDDFIRIYSLSGGDVRFSCSAETPGGAALAPGVFIEKGMVRKFGGRDAGFALNDPVQLENRWWAAACTAGFRTDELPAFPALSKLQLAGFEYASETFMIPKGFDASSQPLPPAAAGAVLSGMTDKNGSLTISASSLNAWTACPFNLLLSSALKVRENEYILYPEDPLTAGIVLHEILSVYFGRIREAGAGFRYAGREAEHAGLIKTSALQVFGRWELEENYFFPPAWESFKRRALRDLLLFPEAEAAFFEGCLPELIEEWLSFPVDGAGLPVRAVGKLDRLSMGPDGAVIVDYKKSWKKRNRESFINEGDDGLLPPDCGYQLPFYILLAREKGYAVAAASYYSITDAKHIPVTGKSGVLDEADTERLCGFTLEQAGLMAARCSEGDFRAAERCDGCDFRTVCRKRYSVRWDER